MVVQERLRSSSDFSRVLRHGDSVARPEFVLYHLARDGRGPLRVGFAVNRKIGNAVIRNRTKRILREAWRPLLPRLTSGVDVVVVARQPAARSTVSELQEALHASAARAGLFHTSEQPEEGTST